jgi:hypothetical protein
VIGPLIIYHVGFIDAKERQRSKRWSSGGNDHKVCQTLSFSFSIASVPEYQFARDEKFANQSQVLYGEKRSSVLATVDRFFQK